MKRRTAAKQRLFNGVAVATCALLTGCGSSGLARPVTLDVPVAVPCQPPVVTHPVWPTQDLTAASSMLDQVRALLAENELRQAYEVQLEAVSQACRDSGVSS